MAKMKDSTKAVLLYLKDNHDKDLTAADVAETLGLSKKQVDGIFTSAFQRQEYGYRQEAERTNPDGSHTRVKFLHLNDRGMALDPDAE